MRNGFTFKNKSSSEFPYIIVKTKDRSVMPAPKTAEYEADNMNGSYDFTDYTGLTFYKNRNVSMDITVLGNGLRELQNRMNAVMVWLRGKGEIIFDDIPAVVWCGRITDSVSYMPEKGGSHAVLSVTFQCEPFTRFIHDAFDGVLIGDKIPIDTNFMLGAPTYYTIEPTGMFEQAITILGDVPVMPVLKKTTQGEWGLSIYNELGLQSFSCSRTDLTTVDCVKKLIYGEDGENYMPDMTGDFITLMPGDNTIISTNQTFELHYTPMYLYNGGLS